MKSILIVSLLALSASPALATGSHSIKGHVRSNGVYVAPSRATNPNATIRDNYSTKPNVNPYSGRVGTVNPNKPAPFKPYRPR